MPENDESVKCTVMLVMTQNVVGGGKRPDGEWKRQARGASGPEEGVLWRTYRGAA